ncbi:MAG TPA: hypothetical protein VKE69_01250 [Planctomycetota bacterium]|nr:hypothetical protein [Planctomycetota bacterium]
MKNGNPCPKCGSKRIVVVPGHTQAATVGSNVRMGPTIFSVIRLSRYLCAACGFSEDWAESPKDLGKLAKKYGVSGEPPTPASSSRRRAR